ncbi:SCO family protein [Salinibacillus xinjiangensis]|uniref:SCO family protein n=1 Tax=Salinibacillus xinjiangensis TaxID=1229268 RepID=A0A6G1X7I4_9BACI|nr:SCO family protein [Salinibacillus xinjiangensis]MRG86963.1 SCO family protein [Salinibacillus xinjiangensis]
MPKKYNVIFATVIAVGIALGILYLEFWRDAGIELPEDITMETVSGESYSFREMEPKVKLVEFFYAKCPDVCPLTTQRMMHLKKMFEEDGVFKDKIEYISVTIDPENDTREEIQEYMDRYGIKENDGWVFLRGSLEDTERLAEPFRFQFKDVGTDFITHTSFAYLLNEDNQLIEKFPMGEAFDKERVYDRVTDLVD